ncbi:MAG: sugar ABC transporter permease [Bacillota bacterium]|nr:sugar ABC transporter permease [Bacillota bacterium]
MSFINEISTLIKKNMRDYGMYLALAVIIGFFTIKTDGLFLVSRNVSNWINQTGYVAALAVGMTLVLIIREIDISVGYLCGFIGAVAAIALTKWKLDWGTSIAISLLVGLLVGMLYGFLIGRLHVPSFVVTLAGMLVFRGLMLYVTEGTGTIIVSNDKFNALSNGFIPDLGMVGKFHLLTLIIGCIGIICFIFLQINARNNQKKYNFEVLSMPIFIIKLTFISAIIAYIDIILAGYRGISWTLVIVLVIVIIYHFMMNKTPLGRHIYGVGGNAQAAELSGINVQKITFFVYSSMGLLTAVAGILTTARFKSATPTAGTAYEMDAIAAAYVGGVSASGGIGKVTGSIVGAFVMSSLNNGMNLMGVGISWQYVIKGIILVLAVLFDITARKSKKTA